MNKDEIIEGFMAKFKPMIDEKVAALNQKLTALELKLSRYEAAVKQQAHTDNKPDAFNTPIVELFGVDALDKLQSVEEEFGSRARYEVELFLRGYACATEFMGREPTKAEQKAIFTAVKRHTDGMTF